MKFFFNQFLSKPTALDFKPTETTFMNSDIISAFKATVDRLLGICSARKNKIIELQAANAELHSQNEAMARELDKMEAELEAIKSHIDAAEPEIGGSTGGV